MHQGFYLGYGGSSRKVGLLQDSSDRIKEKVEAIDRDVERLKVKSNGKSSLSFDSLSELESSMEGFSMGQFKLSLKGLDAFTLYVRDEGVIISYPNFIDMEIPYKRYGYMRQSYWDFKNKKWQ